MKSIYNIVVFAFLFFSTNKANAQFERGSEPGEIYLTTNWYHDLETDTGYLILINSTDYGRTFTKLLVEGWYQFPGTPPYTRFYPDAANDTLYQKYGDTLKISYDNGKIWQNQYNEFGISSKLATGSVKGHVYKNGDGEIYKSIDFGDSFSFINDNVISWRFGVGVGEGSLYKYSIFENPTIFYLYHSFDSGLHFDSVAISENIVGSGGLEGYLCEFSRGALPGELYLMTWHEPVHYKLFRSNDYGETFTFQSEQQGTADSWDEKYFMTGGRASGEVYIIKLKTWIDDYYFRLHVYYSTDYGVTFNEYVHEMDENWNGVAGVENISEQTNITCYPNPCREYTTFNIPEVDMFKNPIIDIFSVYGQQIQAIPVHTNSLEWDTRKLPSGTFLYRIRSDEGFSQNKKLIVIK